MNASKFSRLPVLLASVALAAMALPTPAAAKGDRDASDPIGSLHTSPPHRAAPARAAAHAPAPRALVADTVEDDDDDASPQTEAVHVVKAGETLGGVANRSHVPRVVIIEANNLK